MHDVIPARPRLLQAPWALLLFVGLWTWAIWSCAEHWRGNPNYSYGWAVPLLALGFGLRRLWQSGREKGQPWTLGASPAWRIAGAIAAAATVFALEFARQHVWHPQIVLSLICLLAIVFSLALFFFSGGMALLRAELFPVLFFLTGVPVPPRIEQPITATLMHFVAATTAELLHWLGIAAQVSGGAIALNSGLVGITEACSGVRSLQASVMFGLATGEWFLLRPARRVILLVIAILLAMLTNLGRTLALALQAEWHGIASVETVHDQIGNITMSALIVGIWLAGLLLRPRPQSANFVSPRAWWREVSEAGARLFSLRGGGWAAVAVASLVAFVAARGTYAIIEARYDPQTTAFFVARPDERAGDELIPVPREIWKELSPTSGEYVRRRAEELPRGEANLYHFFWKPSPWNRFALVHRPDICMPGIGWKLAGAPEPIEVDFEGRAVRCYAFRFEQGPYHALQIWGVWRNGDPVSLDYEPRQALGPAAVSPPRQFEGKRRSATEVVACSLIAKDSVPATEMAVAVLRSVFIYRPE